MEFPIKVALAQAVPILPDWPGWRFEPKKNRFSRVRANKNGSGRTCGRSISSFRVCRVVNAVARDLSSAYTGGTASNIIVTAPV
ncbi:hypothetical protein [Streptomyces atratus]|uniref:hypothetical protein n=1 Tax=Streptomyces atratus TaxID=1893 RepID=UPI0036547D80